MKPLAVLLLVLTTHIFAQYRRTTCSILLKSPLPANTRCGSFGTLTTPRNLRNSNILIATVDNCRDECLEDPVCLAFSVNAKKCQLYSASLATMGYKTASAGTRFYEVSRAPSSYCW